jgi:multidrug efflux pump subunit AcrB
MGVPFCLGRRGLCCLAISELLLNVLIGAAVAAVLLLLVFRSFRTMLVVALSMPISILTTFLFMLWMDYSINIVTLLGIGLGTGMIVDPALSSSKIFSARQRKACPAGRR